MHILQRCERLSGELVLDSDYSLIEVCLECGFVEGKLDHGERVFFNLIFNS